MNRLTKIGLVYLMGLSFLFLLLSIFTVESESEIFYFEQATFVKFNPSSEEWFLLVDEDVREFIYCENSDSIYTCKSTNVDFALQYEKDSSDNIVNVTIMKNQEVAQCSTAVGKNQIDALCFLKFNEGTLS